MPNGFLGMSYLISPRLRYHKDTLLRCIQIRPPGELHVIFKYLRFSSALCCFLLSLTLFGELESFRGCFRQKGLLVRGPTSKLENPNRIRGFVERVIHQPISDC
ncbi:uncharacterized protein BDW43DRAFT_257962 [Aspergillus alliaceus]|uniref:uncharacterized protein n=1 Tax=Petromyces alliaceus TaxID=209559 RepID=UPI0012A489C0|nr:uncharacterized protein BDW43DRAFT_257962 [Aspergillus alliaceus]KAB8239410.1 hypothetical protein BDW43DRAFT_257962 [Aspergillus alliaceus]